MSKLVIDINDGFIKRIVVYKSSRIGDEPNFDDIDGDLSIYLASEGHAIIEFNNGKTLKVSGSEWTTLIFNSENDEYEI